MLYTLPNLIIAGCQKSGSTWTHFALDKHPLVTTSKPKELSFFNYPIDEEGIQAYKKHFPENGSKYYLESTPHYFQYPKSGIDVPRSIVNVLGENVQCIVIFRNPIERAISAIIHHMMKGRVKYTEVINEIPEGQLILELGRYTDILKHWQSVLGDSLIIRFYDDLVENPLVFYNSILQVLNLDECVNGADLQFRVNDKNVKLKDSDLPGVPGVSMELIEELHAIYRMEIANLESLTQRNLDSWHDLDSIFRKNESEQQRLRD